MPSSSPDVLMHTTAMHDVQAEEFIRSRALRESEAMRRKEIVDLVDERIAKIYEVISKHANTNDERIAHLEAERLDLSQRVGELQLQAQYTVKLEATVGQLRAKMSDLCEEMKNVTAQQEEQGLAVEGLHDLESRLVQHLEIARTDQQADHVRLREDVERFMASGVNGGGGDWSTLQRKCDELTQAMEIHFSSLRQADVLQPLELERQERSREIGELVDFVQSERQHRIQHVEELALRQQRAEEELQRAVHASLERLREDVASQLSRQAERSVQPAEADRDREVRTAELESLRSAVQRLEKFMAPVTGRGGLAVIDDVKLEMECGLQQHREQNRREFFQLQASVQEQVGPDLAGDVAALRKQLLALQDALHRLKLELDAFQEGTAGSFARVQAQVQDVAQCGGAEAPALRELRDGLQALRAKVDGLQLGHGAGSPGAGSLSALVDELQQALQAESMERRVSIGDIHARLRQEVATLAARIESKALDASGTDAKD